MKSKNIKINLSNQKYLFDIIKKYPNISSGRKNYSAQYKRVLKNILLSKAYQYLTFEKIFKCNFMIVENNKSITLKIDNKKT